MLAINGLRGPVPTSPLPSVLLPARSCAGLLGPALGFPTATRFRCCQRGSSRGYWRTPGGQGTLFIGLWVAGSQRYLWRSRGPNTTARYICPKGETDASGRNGHVHDVTPLEHRQGRHALHARINQPQALLRKACMPLRLLLPVYHMWKPLSGQRSEGRAIWLAATVQY